MVIAREQELAAILARVVTNLDEAKVHLDPNRGPQLRLANVPEVLRPFAKRFYMVSWLRSERIPYWIGGVWRPEWPRLWGGNYTAEIKPVAFSSVSVKLLVAPMSDLRERFSVRPGGLAYIDSVDWSQSVDWSKYEREIRREMSDVQLAVKFMQRNRGTTSCSSTLVRLVEAPLDHPLDGAKIL